MGTTTEDSKFPGGLIMAPRVPHGLAAAVEGLTREVIRRRPEDIYVFAAQHFEQLLKLRDQYGPASNLPGKSSNSAALRAMNQAVKRKDAAKEKRNNRRDSAGQGGWSLNETANVLEKHRSIFGDVGRKVSTEEVRALAHEKENKFSRDGRARAKSKEELRKYDNKRKSSERFVRRSRETEEKSRGDSLSVRMDSNGAPRIISQIPTLTGSTTMLAKDIKTELRKNRISSRERRSVGEKADKKSVEESNASELSARKTGTIRKSASRKSYRERSLEKFLEREKQREVDGKTVPSAGDGQKHRMDRNGYSRSLQKIPRTSSMDRVKDFVVREFRASESLDELQSVNYVDRVQEVIDDRAPVIREKVEELKLGRLGSAGRRSKNGYESVDESTSTSERSDKSNQTDDIRSLSAVSRSRKSRRTNSRKRSTTLTSESRGNDSLEGIETLASETETPKGAANLEAKLNETQDLLQGISSAFSATGEKERVRRSRSVKGPRKNGSVSGESDVSDYLDVPRSARNSANVSFPAVRSCSSRNASRSVSRSDSDNLVLPPISPEAPKSAKRREELILPILSPPGSAPSTADSRVPATPDIIDLVKTSRDPATPEVDGALLGDSSEPELNLPDPPAEEIFKDSLNVTPDMAEVPPRPDSLEPYGVLGEDDEAGDAIDALKSKLMEIETAERNIERIFGPGAKEEKENEGSCLMRGKLREIEDTERRIGEIFGREARKVSENVTVKERLIEIEDTEKRIQDIFETDAEKEGTDTVKNKLAEIRTAEEKIQRVFESGGQLLGKEIVSQLENENSPLIPELPCEEVGRKDDVDVIEFPLRASDERLEVSKTDETVAAGVEEGETNNSEHVNEATKNKVDTLDTDVKERKNEIDNSFSLSPDTMPYSYVLTEGSPYEIPDSVTTVIIPERLVESPGSEVLEIFLEDDAVLGTAHFAASEDRDLQKSAVQKSPSDIEGRSAEAAEPIVELAQDNERTLKEVLDSFGNRVPPETIECSSVDIDFIRGVKPGHDVIVARQDLDRIKEEDDREVEEALQVVADSESMIRESTKILEDIQEKDESGETVDETKRGEGTESGEPGPEELLDSKTSGELETSVEVLEEVREERLKNVTGEESSEANSSTPPEAAASAGDLLNVTDSESSGEIKETSVTDGIVENTAADFSDNSPEGEESSERITESSDEVKETTVTDRLVDDIGSASLNQANLRSMPRIPELNLDSLQDITVSSFQMTEDEMEKGADGESRQESEGTVSLVEPLTSDETKQQSSSKIDDSREEIVEGSIVKEQAETKAESLTSEETKSELDTGKGGEGGGELGELVQETIVKEQAEMNEEPFEVSSVNSAAAERGEGDKELDHGNSEEKVAEGFVVKEQAETKKESLTSDETKSEPGDPGKGDEGDEAEKFVQESIMKEHAETKAESLTSDETKSELDTGKGGEGGGELGELVQETIVKEQAETNEEPFEVSSVNSEAAERGEGDKELGHGNSEEKVAEGFVVKEQAETKEESLKSGESRQEMNTEAVQTGKRVEVGAGVGSGDSKEEVAEEQTQMNERQEPKTKVDDTGRRAEGDEAVNREEVVEDLIMKEEVEVKEEPCEKVTAYLTEPDEGSGMLQVEEVHQDCIEAKTVTDILSGGAEVEISEAPSECDNVEETQVTVKSTEDEEGKRSTENNVEEIENGEENLESQGSAGVAVKASGNNVESSGVAAPLEKSESLTSTVETTEGEKTTNKTMEAAELNKQDGRNLTMEPEKEGERSAAVEPDKEEENTAMEPDKEDVVNVKFSESVGNSEVVKNVSPPEAEVVTNDLDDYGVTGERKQYHIYVPEVAGSEESTTTESSTFNSAATKIQAGVRGFLTRRRLQSAQRRSSTLDSVPSIQDSFAADAAHLSPIEEVGLSQAATTIQSNYRGYKARQRLRREDAVQKTTLSVENAFGGNGLQHTGEFHDCLPLPLFTDREKKSPPRASRDNGRPDNPARRTSVDLDEKSRKPEDDARATGEKSKVGKVEARNLQKNGEAGPSSREEDPEKSVALQSGEEVFSLLHENPGAKEELNFVAMASSDLALQKQYLNFITSVEEAPGDANSSQEDFPKAAEVSSSLKSTAGVESLPLDSVSESVSLREPLAVPGSPRGVVIEELSSTEDDNKTSVPYFYPETPETDAGSAGSGLKSLGMREESVDPEMSSLEAASEPVSLDCENAFLESSPISLNDPTSPEASVKRSVEEARRREPDDGEEKTDVAEKLQASLEGQRPPLVIPEFELDEDFGERRPVLDVPGSSLLPDASLGTMSFSMNVDDMLGFGAESEVLDKDKPILEVTVTSRDLLKLTSASQESQLSGERVESPITMMQIVPRSVDEKSERAEDERREEAARDESVDGPEGEEEGEEGVKVDAKRSQKKRRSQSKEEASLKEEQVEEVKEQASPKENDSRSVGTTSVAESADTELSGRTSRTYSVDRDSARTYFDDKEGSVRTMTSREEEV